MIKEIATKLEALLPIELVKQIKEYHAKLSEGTTPESTEVKLMKEAKTKDGKIVATETEFVEGAPFMEVSETGAIAGEGTYELETGEVITVVGGLITEVKKVESTEPTPDPNAEMQAKFDAQANELNEMKSRLESVTKQNVDLAAALKKILDTPIEIKQEKHEQVDTSKMTALEYRRYVKSLEK